MMISAGYKRPAVESVLLEHEAIAECGVIPDNERGQIVKALVVVKPGYGADDARIAQLQASSKAT